LSQTIGEIPKNAPKKYVATPGEFQGKTRIDIRVYYKTESDNWRSTKKGVNMDTETWPEFKTKRGNTVFLQPKFRIFNQFIAKFHLDNTIISSIWIQPSAVAVWFLFDIYPRCILESSRL